MIDGHKNQEKEIENRIPQRSPVSPILFLIYINEVFEQVEKELPGIVVLSFVDDLGFIAFEVSVKEIAKTLEKVGKIVFEWEEKNAVTYDMATIKLVLFFHARQRHLNQQLQETTVLIGEEKVQFNKEAIR